MLLFHYIWPLILTTSDQQLEIKIHCAMNLDAPVSTIMSSDLKIASPEDKVSLLNDYFKQYKIHHVPVVEEGKVVGIISKSDFLFLLRGFTVSEMDRFTEATKLNAFKVSEIMVKDVTTIEESAPIREAVDLLSENRFRSLPVVNDSGSLVGMLTTHDIIDMIKENG